MRILYVGMCTGENGFTKAMKKYATHYDEVNCGDPYLHTTLTQAASYAEWDIVFLQIQTPGIVNGNLIQKFKDKGAIVFNFTGDVRTPLPQWYKELAPHITSTIFTNMNDVKEMRSLGFKSDWMEYGFDTEIYKPEGKIKVVPPIVFMGNNYGTGYFPLSQERIDTVNTLKKEFGKDFGVYGNGWSTLTDGNFNHSQEEEAAVYRGAKIAINLSHFEYEDYSSDRLLRILGTGTMCITRWFPGCDKLPVISYKTIEELVELCKLLLPEHHRLIIAKGGYYYAVSNFTFDHMIQNIIKLYEKYKA